MNIKFNIITAIFSFLTITTYAQDQWSNEQKQIIETMNLLSETTAPDGKGADAYSKYLSDYFSRWTIGSSITNNKKK